MKDTNTELTKLCVHRCISINAIGNANLTLNIICYILFKPELLSYLMYYFYCHT